MARCKYQLQMFTYVTVYLIVHFKKFSAEVRELDTTPSIFDERFVQGLTLVDGILRIEQSVCSSTCRSGYPNTELMKCAACYCDLLCRVYQDCCPDVLLTHGVTYNQSVTRCMSVKPVEEERPDSDVRTNFVVKCSGQRFGHEGVMSTGDAISPAYSREVSDKCQHPDVTDPKQSLPVTSLDSGITYRNIYCAQCHSDNTNVTRWDLSIECLETSLKLLNGPFSKLEIFKRLMTREGSAETGCQLSFVPKAVTHSRECHFSEPDLIGACNVSGQWKHFDERVERACAMYTSVFLFEYRNMFCYICNSGYLIDKVMQLDMLVQEDPAVTVARLDYAALMNFDEDLSGTTEELSVTAYKETVGVEDEPKERCSTVEIYDDVTCQCHRPMCAEGKTLSTNGSCQSIVYSNILGYHACVMVEVEIARPMSYRSFDQFIVYTKFMDLPPMTKHSLHISKWCPNDTKISIGWEMYVTREGTLEDLEQEIDQLLLVLVRTVEKSFNDRAISSKFTFIDHCRPDTLQPLPCPRNQSIVYPTIVPRVLIIDSADDERVHYIEFSEINKCSFMEVDSSKFRDFGDYYEFIPNGVKVWSSNLHFYNASLIRISVEDYLNLTQTTKGHRTCSVQSGTTDTWTISGLVSVISTCVSLTGLLLTLITFTLFEPLRAGGGKNMMTLIVCLIVAQTFYEFALEQYESPRACALFGIVIHFSWLAALFAMNACTLERFYKLCFPLSSRVFFMSKKPTLIATLYTFLGPSVIVGANIAANLTLRSNIGYGSTRVCFLNAPIARFVTFGIPVGVIVFINVLLMGVTVYKLRGRETARSCSNAHSKLGLMAVARLSMVTGLMWLLTFLYDIVRSDYFNYVITALIGLHGLLFFYCIVINRRVISFYAELWTRWRVVETRSRSNSCSKEPTEGKQWRKVPQGTTSDTSIVTSSTGCDSRQSALSHETVI